MERRGARRSLLERLDRAGPGSTVSPGQSERASSQGELRADGADLAELGESAVILGSAPPVHGRVRTGHGRVQDVAARNPLVHGGLLPSRTVPVHRRRADGRRARPHGAPHRSSDGSRPAARARWARSGAVDRAADPLRRDAGRGGPSDGAAHGPRRGVRGLRPHLADVRRTGPVARDADSSRAFRRVTHRQQGSDGADTARVGRGRDRADLHRHRRRRQRRRRQRNRHARIRRVAAVGRYHGPAGHGHRDPDRQRHDYGRAERRHGGADLGSGTAGSLRGGRRDRGDRAFRQDRSRDRDTHAGVDAGPGHVAGAVSARCGRGVEVRVHRGRRRQRSGRSRYRRRQPDPGWRDDPGPLGTPT